MAFNLFKRRLLPADRRPAFDPTERVLAWAPSDSDTVVVTNLGLWWGGTRTGWHLIAKAAWDGETLLVTPWEVLAEREGYLLIRDLPPVRLPLTDPDHVPNQVRLRVTGSVVAPMHHDLVDGAGVWISARRVPGVDGLTWTARLDPGTSPDDPDILAQVDALVYVSAAPE